MLIPLSLRQPDRAGAVSMRQRAFAVQVPRLVEKRWQIGGGEALTALCCPW
jgi:hypothetical protein